MRSDLIPVSSFLGERLFQQMILGKSYSIDYIQRIISKKLYLRN